MQQYLVLQQLVGDICGVFVLTVVTRFKISNIFESFVIFVKRNYQSIINFSHLTHFRIFLEQPQVYIYRKFNPKMNKIRDFFSKIRTLFSIFEKEQGRPPPPPAHPTSCAPDMICRQDMHC